VAAVIDDDETVEAATTKEEKNAFAMRVLRRIRTKLEGREPGENKAYFSPIWQPSAIRMKRSHQFLSSFVIMFLQLLFSEKSQN
jgi:hypothetical protein